MSTPQQDPKRREPGMYHIKIDDAWTVMLWYNYHWWPYHTEDPLYEVSGIQDIDERRIEHGDTQRIAELEAQVRELESRLEERINQG